MAIMKKRSMLAAVVALVPIGSALAQDVAISDDAAHLLCDAGLVVDCNAEGECTTGSPESVDLPRFLHLDLSSNELSSPSPGFDSETTPLDRLDSSGAQIVIGGSGRGDRVFSMSISKSTGAMRGSVLAEDFNFLVFGACIELGG
jgi:hypothetical protein